MSRRVLALPWVVGSLCLACGGERRDFGETHGERQGEADGGAASPGETADASSVGASDAGSGSSDATRSSDGFSSSPDGVPSTEGTTGADAGGPVDTSGGDDTATTPAGPTLDGPCSKGGVRACDVNDAKQTLVCSQGRWQSNGGCATKYNCDPSAGACSEIVPGCEDRVEGARYCQPGDQLWECGPNSVSETLVETCEGNCAPDGETATCASPGCGDGKTQANEVCDDANDDNEDACTTLCKPPECGDGLRLSTELCDDGNDDENDSCTTACAPPRCGDGLTQSSEECDDGNDIEDDACTTTCKVVACGEGTRQWWELCEDGNAIAGDGCSPTCVPEVAEVVSFYESTCALRVDGYVKCWGYNPYGQLGVGMTDTLGDAPYEMGSYLPEADLGAGRTALQVGTGFHNTCALLDNGRVKCWGLGSLGVAGVGDTETRGDQPGEMGDNLAEIDLGTDARVQRIAVGGYHVCALLTDGRVKCWGANTDGQLGLGDLLPRGDDPGEMGDNLLAVDLGAGRTAQRIAAGNYHTCAVLDNFELKCWGYNGSGQLGREDNSAAGDSPGEMGDALAPINLGAERYAIDVFAGNYSTCAILDTGAVKCWGYNSTGQLGQAHTASLGAQPSEMGDNLQAIDLGYGRTAIGVAMGYSHACALLDTHELKCWGNGSSGQLGLESADVRGDEMYEMGDNLPVVQLGAGLSVRSVTAGQAHTCAVLSDGNVKCWGYNASGTLGQGHTELRGDVAGQMGDNLPVTVLW